MPSITNLMNANPAVKWGIIAILVIGAYFAVRWIVDQVG